MFLKFIFLKDMILSEMARNGNHLQDIINHQKYANNYDFNKAVYLVNKENFHDTGYLLLKEDRDYHLLFQYFIMNIIIHNML